MRYSHSKIDQFKTCPKKYDYQYNQDLNPIEDSIHLTVGKLYHSAVEAILTNGDPKPFYEDFKYWVRKGMLPNCRENTLEDVVNDHFVYYAQEEEDREYIMIETKFEEELGEDIFSGMIDDLYTKLGYYYLEDHKSTINKLKYKEEDVRLNRQLHKYAYVARELYFIEVDFITIDEVVIRKYDDVPYLKNGDPGKDTKALAFVRYEDYMQALEIAGVENEQAYQGAIAYLKDRGHPLFKKHTVELNQQLMENINEEYGVVIKAIKANAFYRHRSPLCNYCAYKDICTLETIGGQDDFVAELKASKFIPRESEDAEELL